jgi:hypothetical protein
MEAEIELWLRPAGVEGWARARERGRNEEVYTNDLDRSI